jgi:hypothetical protein
VMASIRYLKRYIRTQKETPLVAEWSTGVLECWNIGVLIIPLIHQTSILVFLCWREEQLQTM